uniref:Uncharacterized protein n=1 Tax=viral metagenome TaxID=1070528 RepID=A0A6M3L7Z7_9ZZZZ
MRDRIIRLIQQYDAMRLQRMLDYWVPVNAWHASVFWKCLDCRAVKCLKFTRASSDIKIYEN